MNIYEQTQEKLAAYHLEADIRRRLPKSMWRAEAAQILRSLAERLEPTRTVSVS